MQTCINKEGKKIYHWPSCFHLFAAINLKSTFKNWDWLKSFPMYSSWQWNPTKTLQFNFETIRMATNNFSEANMLGWGGFGLFSR